MTPPINTRTRASSIYLRAAIDIYECSEGWMKNLVLHQIAHQMVQVMRRKVTMIIMRQQNACINSSKSCWLQQLRHYTL